MLEFLVAHFGIPLVAGLVLVFMTAASVLGLGITGFVFYLGYEAAPGVGG